MNIQQVKESLRLNEPIYYMHKETCVIKLFEVFEIALLSHEIKRIHRY